MKAKLNFFLLLVALITCAGCSSYVDELVSEDEGILSRAVSSEYYIRGADYLYTGSPETYTLIRKDGTALNGVYVIQWDYSSELNRVSSDNTSITLGRKTALGEYTLTAILNNGESISKKIIAEDKVINPPSTKTTFRMNPAYVATALEGPYTASSDYLMMSTGHYLVSSRIFLKCLITNQSTSCTLNPSLLSISLGESTRKHTVTWYDANFEQLTSQTIPAGKSIDVYFQLPSSYMDYRIDIDIPQMTPSLYHVTNVHFYYGSTEQECSLYNFLFSTRAEQNRN